MGVANYSTRPCRRAASNYVCRVLPPRSVIKRDTEDWIGGGGNDVPPATGLLSRDELSSPSNILEGRDVLCEWRVALGSIWRRYLFVDVKSARCFMCGFYSITQTVQSVKRK